MGFQRELMAANNKPEVVYDSSPNRFGKIKKYLSNLRQADVVLDEETDCLIAFCITDRKSGNVKEFRVHYCDSFEGARSLDKHRPKCHYYYLQFDQDLVPSRSGDLENVFEWKWYSDEDDVLTRIKDLRRRYNR